MKNQFLLLFLFFCFICFGQETNSKSAVLNKGLNTTNKDIEESSNNYYGSGKSNVVLNGRNLANQGTILPDCNDEGTVIVEIEVNQSGIVTNAKFSPRGSNTTSKCLHEAAIKSAYKYKWNEDSKAPENQIGFLVFNFRNAE
ncbi:hypothetical protein [Flavobacterium sp.]|jgi:translation elongation factor EF-Ts|uniref:hypothetical protein n=1 Tax=Flavobacterium sp. TaxID=239 RepID=UPI0037C02125